MEIFKIIINEDLKGLDIPLQFLGLKEPLTDKGMDDLHKLIKEYNQQERI